MKYRLLIASLTCALMAGAGCSTLTKEDVDASHASLEAKLEAKIAQSAAELEQKITAIDSKYASMLALEQKVQNGLQKIDEHADLLAESNAVFARILQSHRNALKEQLRSIEDQLNAIQPKSDS